MLNVLASIAAACERRIVGKRECIVRIRLMAPSLYTYPDIMTATLMATLSQNHRAGSNSLGYRDLPVMLKELKRNVCQSKSSSQANSHQTPYAMHLSPMPCTRSDVTVKMQVEFPE